MWEGVKEVCGEGIGVKVESKSHIFICIYSLHIFQSISYSSNAPYLKRILYILNEGSPKTHN